MFKAISLFVVCVFSVAPLTQLEAAPADDVVCTKCVGTSDIADLAVTSTQIKGSTITGSKIAASAISSTKIRDGAVTLTKVAPQLRNFIGKVCPFGYSVNGIDSSGNLICEQTGVVTNKYTNYDNSGVVSLTCPAGEVITSVNGKCDYVNGSRNFGVLFMADIAGNGGVVGCFDYLYDPYLPTARAYITIACGDQDYGYSAVSATSVDGAESVAPVLDESMPVVDEELDAALQAARQMAEQFRKAQQAD